MKSMLVFFLAVFAGMSAQAHDARPLSITLAEQSTGLYRAVVRIPPSLAPNESPEIQWPRGCEVIEGGPSAVASLYGVVTRLLACSGGLANGTIAIDYPQFNPSISTLIRLETLSGAALTTVLPPDIDSWTVPPQPSWFRIAAEYASLGFRHIWEGPDHLLFVAGLLVLAVFPRRIVWAVTGFTVAHSITLSLATLGWVRVPIAPTEALIALSIVFVAVEISRRDPKSFSYRFPISLSFAFGLLHGFGFASALGEIGLPRHELATGLLFFNVGVELGQLTFIAVAAAALLASRVLLTRFRRRLAGAQSRVPVLLCAYCLGIPAAFWFIERMTLIFA